MNSMVKKFTENKFSQTLKIISPKRLWQSWMRSPKKNIVMDKFIKTVEVFDEKTCQTIVDLFEASEAKQRIETVSYTHLTLPTNREV